MRSFFNAMHIYSLVFGEMKSRLGEVQEIAPPVLCKAFWQTGSHKFHIQLSLPRNMTADQGTVAGRSYCLFSCVIMLHNIFL